MIAIAATEDRLHWDRLVDLLDDHAAMHGRSFAFTDVGFEATEGPARLGGLSARISQGWMFIGLLVVAEEARGRGIGRRLIGAAEAEARKRGCIGIWLDTYSFQAPDFYRRLGFTEFGRIDDYPMGEARHFFQKRLDG